ncbi:MAG: hypothetical protein QF507_00160 [Vicinamibacterales bacterium]|nr:hypothetical protein [Acidobacteriota bacterium]MDP7210168.1 hypothetical protein [Vicinamibacterales bacterium]HJO18039.1 hypothetical protein [Vicinamibacterales bacterium]
MSGWCRRLLISVLFIVSAGASTSAQQRFALIVSGASGGSPYAERYDRWRGALVSSLRSDLHFQEEDLFVLAEIPGPRVGRASQEGIRQVTRTLARRLSDDATLLVVLIGHGTFDGIDAKFNLVGPDLDAAEWRSLLEPLPGRLIFANTTSASFPFLEYLTGERRIVITATNSPEQRYETQFAAFFVEAFKTEASDFDKDGRVSIWEAFTRASSGVGRWYEQQGRVSTERPILDDTGDGVGKVAGEPGLDGTLARRVFLDRSVEADQLSDQRLAGLLDQRNILELEVEVLKAQVGQLARHTYEAEMEILLLKLARVSHEIRARQ